MSAATCSITLRARVPWYARAVLAVAVLAARCGIRLDGHRLGKWIGQQIKLETVRQ